MSRKQLRQGLGKVRPKSDGAKEVWPDRSRPSTYFNGNIISNDAQNWIKWTCQVTCWNALGNSFLKFNAALIGKIDGRSGSTLELRIKDKKLNCAMFYDSSLFICSSIISFHNLKTKAFRILSSLNLSNQSDSCGSSSRVDSQNVWRPWPLD